MAMDKKDEKSEVKLDETLDKSLGELENELGVETVKAEDEDDKKKDKDKKEDEEVKDKKDEDEDEETKDKKEDEDEEDKGKKDEDEEAKGKKKEDDEAKDKKKDKKDEEDEEEGEDEDEGKTKEKSFAEKVNEDKGMKDALEVSDFLKNIVKSLSDSMDKISERLSALEKSDQKVRKAIVKSVGTQNEMIKSLAESVDGFGDTAVPPKSKKVLTVDKSFRGNENGDGSDLTKAQITDKLAQLECDGKIEVGSTTRFEVSGLISASAKKLILGE